MSNPYGSDPYGQPSANDPYGQSNQPYGQAGAGDPQQQHDAYGQMTGYTSAGSSQSASDPYQGDAYSSADPYGSAEANPYDPAPNPYGAYSEATATKPKRSPLLGVLALIIGGLGVIVSLIMAIVGGNAFTSIVEAVGTTDIPDVPPPGLEDQYASFGITFLVYLATAVPIVAGLIMGIISIATNRGRLFGIISTVLAVLGPIIVFVVFFVIAGPAAMSQTP